MSGAPAVRNPSLLQTAGLGRTSSASLSFSLIPGVSGALPSSPLQRELADGKAKHTGSLLGFPCPVVPSTPARLCSSPTVNQGPERYGPCRLPLIQFGAQPAHSLPVCDMLCGGGDEC